MRTVGNKVIVQPIMVEERSVSGIIVPDMAMERSSKAIVVAVGGGTEKRPMKIEVGKTYFHVKGAGAEIEIDGKKFYVMADTDLRAVLEN